MRHNQIRGRRLTFQQKKTRRARDRDDFIAYQVRLNYRNRKTRRVYVEISAPARKAPVVIVREVWIIRIVRLVIAYFKTWRRKAKKR